MIERIEIGLTWQTNKETEATQNLVNRRLNEGWRIINQGHFTYDGEVTEFFTLYKPDKTEAEQALADLGEYEETNPDVLAALGETPAAKFNDGDLVMVATHGIGATFFHKAKIEDSIQVDEYGKKVRKYAVRYIDSDKLRIDVNEYDIKPFSE